MNIALQFKQYSRCNIIKGKLGSDVGQPRILTGDTRVSHINPSGAGHLGFTSSYPSCPTSSPGFSLLPMDPFLPMCTCWVSIRPNVFPYQPPDPGSSRSKYQAVNVYIFPPDSVTLGVSITSRPWVFHIQLKDTSNQRPSLILG